MPGITTPPVIVAPFGLNAAPGDITLPIPVGSPGVAGAASFDIGFPHETMLPIVAGGTPPFGQDMNGILYMVTASIAAVQAGAPWLYNTTIVAAIGGYPVGVVLSSADGAGLWINQLAANVSDPDGGGATGWAALYSYGPASLTLSNANVTLPPAQWKKQYIFLNGALTGNVSVILPARSQSWLIINNCTGNFTVTARTPAGTGVLIPQGGNASPTGIYSDTANVYPSVAPLAVPISIAPTPQSIVERDNNGYVYATYLNQNSISAENPAIGAIFVESTGGDGFLRKAAPAYFVAQLSLVQTSAMNTAIATAVSSALAPYSTTTAMNAAIATAAAAVVTTGSNANGRWVRYSNGVIEQWGTIPNTTPGSPITRTYPIPFINAVESLTATANGVQGTVVTSLPSASKSSFTATNGASGSTTSWRASGT